MTMRKLKFILSLLLCVLLNSNNYAQAYKLILDSLVDAREVYLDRLNQIYLVNSKDKFIQKLDPDFKLLWKIEFKYHWDNIRLDLSDPFKPLIYFPGDYYLALTDDRLNELNRIDETLLSMNAELCRLNGNEYAVYDGNAITIRNNQTNQFRHSGIIIRPNTVPQTVRAQLKSNKGDIYLCFPGYGIMQFNDQLFKIKELVIPNLGHFDLASEQLLFIKNNNLFKINPLDAYETIIQEFPENIVSFSANTDRLAVLGGGKLTVFLKE